LYANADVYLIDDCLSALDVHVGRKIFYNVIKNMLKGKTIIFVTHALNYLPDFDKVAVFKEGNLVETGIYETLKE